MLLYTYIDVYTCNSFTTHVYNHMYIQISEKQCEAVLPILYVTSGVSV